MKKIISTLFVIVLIALFVCILYNKNNDKNTTNEKVFFSEKLCSFYEGEIEFDLDFYISNQRENYWELNNIEKTELIIGDENFDVEISELNISDNQVADKIDKGNMVITGDITVASGETYLSMKRYNDKNIYRYYLGKYSIVKDIDNNNEIKLFDAGGVVKTDEDGYVYNYGVILNIFSKEDINIMNIDFGLNSEVAVDEQNIKIYSEKEYKSEIFQLIDEANLDSKISNAYVKRFFSKKEINPDSELKIKKGKSYIYIPLKYREDNNVSLSEAVVTAKYKTMKGEKTVSNSAIFFLEISKDKSQILKMFE